MPEVIIPLVVAIGGSLVGKAVSGGGPSSEDLQKQIQAQQAQQKQQQDLATKEAVLRQAPSIQAQLGGAVAPEYYIQEASREAGAAGEENVARQALQGFLGLSGTSGGATSGTTAPGLDIPIRQEGQPPNFVEDILTRFGGGGSTGDTGTSGGYL